MPRGCWGKKTMNQITRRWVIGCAAVGAALVIYVGALAESPKVRFLSTQFAPVDEAARFKNEILNASGLAVEFIPMESSTDFVAAVNNKEGEKFEIVGGLQGDLLHIARAGAIEDATKLVSNLGHRRFSSQLMGLAMNSQGKNLFVPWATASFLMVANKKALPYLPPDADIRNLTYEQLSSWAMRLKESTGRPRLGMPMGPRGLFHRFIQGYLLPSFTGGMLTQLTGDKSAQMWHYMRDLWPNIAPESLSFNAMDREMRDGEIWVGWDHSARLITLFRDNPEKYVAFPAPIGPAGRGQMVILAGLAMTEAGTEREEPGALLSYLLHESTQLKLLEKFGFFPVLQPMPEIPPTSPASALADALSAQLGGGNAKLAVLPSGLSDKSSAFNAIFSLTFTRIVLRNESIWEVADRQALALQEIMNEKQLSCFAPDPVGYGICRVR